MRKALFLFVLFIVVLMSGESHAQGARAALHQGFGRIAFDWNEPVRHQAAINNRNLIVAFDRPVAADTQSLVRKLRGYINSVTASPDRRRVTFSLKKDFSLRSFTMGSSVIIDLVDVQEETAPEKNSDTGTPRTADNVSELNIRIGIHKTYDRIVFDWKNKTKYTLSRKGNTVSISFYKNAKVDDKKIRAKFPARYKGFSSKSGGKGLTVTVPVPQDIKIKHFAVDSRVVLDITKTKKARPEKTKEEKQPEKPQEKETKANDKAKETKETKETEKDKLQKPVELIKKKPLTEKKAAEKTPDKVKKVEPEKTKSVKKQEENDYLPPVDRNVPKRRIVSLAIPWHQSTASAVFKRGGYLWIVFDRHKQIDINTLKKVGGNVLVDIIQIPHGSATVLRLITKPGYNPSLRREGMLWIVDLMQQPLRPKVTINTVPQLKTESGAKLFFPVSEASSMISVVDPGVGDNMLIVPFVPLGRGMFPRHEYPDLELPVTAQGLVVFAKNPDVKIRTSRVGIEVLSPEYGLKLSSDTENLAAFLSVGDKDLRKELFTVDAWSHGGDEFFEDNKKKLMKAIVSLNENKKNNTRLELARLFIAHNNAAEAQGILRTIASDDPKWKKKQAYIATKGIADFLMYRYKEAVASFSRPTFAGNDEAAFWRAAAEASIGNPEKQAATLKSKSATIRMYPRWLKTKLALIGVNATLEDGDDLGAQNFLEAAEDENNTAYQKAALTYYKGVWNEISGAFKPALKNYEEVEGSSSRMYRALAARAKVKLELATSLIDPVEAGKKLERLRFVWRGDDYEYKLLNLLADMYVTSKNYGNGLRMMKHIASNFRNYPEADKIPEKMRKIFDELFYKGKADELSPISAIGLYDEFRELSPSGKKGNEIINRLADRLVSVDLLQRASDLLEKQVFFRLTGVEKARVGTRLALVNLLNKKPEEALNALQKSKIENMPAKLVVQRRHLMARALSDAGRYDDAIKLLEYDKTKRGTLLKAEVYWQGKKWSDAADVIQTIITKPEKGEKLPPDQIQLVLDWTTALRLAGRDRAVMRLRYNFMPYIKGTKYYDIFNLLTSGDEGGPIDYRTVGDQIKEAENFSSFMGSYIDSLKTGGLSSIN